jgi:glycerol-3-phosphate dehydrogenase (NAD(P)+)
MNAASVGVIGGGAWGTALAVLAAQRGGSVIQWMRDAETAGDINRNHQNSRRLPGIALPPAIEAVTDPARLARTSPIIVAIPAQHMREVLTRFASHLRGDAPVILAAKGYEQTTDASMTRIAAETLSLQAFVLSGPTFAADVARGLPAAAVLAGARAADAQRLAGALSTASFRIYYSDDVTGVQFGGAVKNVLAIASGMCAGMKLGDSARAALITRASSELMRLGRARGIRFETLNGLSCLGDLILTSMSVQSRNFSLGKALGEGRSLADALASIRGVCEGLQTAPVVERLARELDTDAPICEAVAAILAGRSTSAAQVSALLGRPLKAE